MINRELIREGMTVFSADGHKLGKVVALGNTEFQIEKGYFFPKDSNLTYEQVQEVSGNDVIISEGKALLASRWNERPEVRANETMRIPLTEEELDIVKREASRGDVKIHKRVEVEEKNIKVPVRKERVTVERVAGSEATSAAEPASTAGTFQEETISVPVMEEEVEVRKRPVVREELRVRKDSFQEERRVAESVRSEKADVDENVRRDRDDTSNLDAEGKPLKRY